MEITSSGTPGPALDDTLNTLDNNVRGTVVENHTPEQLARLFLAAGWSARKSSWTDYEVHHVFAELEFVRHDGKTLFHGIVDPDRVTDLADQFASLGLSCSIELREFDNGPLLRELRVDGHTSTHLE